MTILTRTRDAMGDIVDNAGRVSNAIDPVSQESARASRDRGVRNEKTVADPGADAPAIEQMGSAVELSSAPAAQGASGASDSARVAQSSRAMLRDVIITMCSIQDLSHKIGAITGIIDGIAFRSNIIALNAAVEAAGSDERGRAFAAVATDIHRHALHTAVAAKEISVLITDSLQNAEAGASIAVETGEIVDRLVVNARVIKDLMARISTAAQAENVRATHIAMSLQALDHRAQRDSALVGQTAAAIEWLNDLAIDLAEHVERFSMPALVAAGTRNVT